MDAVKLREEIVQWLCDYLQESGKQGYVVGMSGGIDSTVIALLGKEATERLGKKFLGCYCLFTTAVKITMTKNLLYG